MLALGSSLLYGLAFPPLPFSWFGWIALIPLGLALELRARSFDPARSIWKSGFGLGYFAGFFLFLAGLHWIAFLSGSAVTVPGIMFPAWPAAAAYLAIYPALAAAVAFSLRIRLGWSIAWTLPILWIGFEKLRSIGEMAFPWLSLAYTQWDTIAVLQWASIGGPALVGLWLAVANGAGLAAVFAILSRRKKSALIWGAAMALAVAIPVLAGQFLLLPEENGIRKGSTIGLVQGNILGERKWDRSRQQGILADFIALSRQSLSKNPSLLIWPETATGAYLRRDPLSFSTVQSFVDSSGVPIIAGYPDWRPLGADDYEGFNAAGLFVPQIGLIRQYNKINLVPFGERLPFQRFLPFLGKLDLGQAEWTPGDSLVLMPTGSDTAAVLICFESSLSEMSREARLRGANLLVVITNDEWFGRTGALYQHAAMSCFRAVETRLPVARCANTGLSFFVDIRGRIHDQGGVFTREVLVAQIDRPGPLTPFVKYGDILGWGLLLVSGGLLVLSLVAPIRRF